MSLSTHYHIDENCAALAKKVKKRDGIMKKKWNGTQAYKLLSWKLLQIEVLLLLCSNLQMHRYTVNAIFILHTSIIFERNVYAVLNYQQKSIFFASL